MFRIDEFPTMEKHGVRYGRGHVLPYGATVLYNGAVNFSVSSKDATYAELLLYHLGEREPFVVIPFPEGFRIGSTFSMMVFDLNIEEIEYGYRFDGPYDPEKGYRFDKEKILLDPYAKLISGRDEWGSEVDETNPYQHRARIIFEDYNWEDDKPLEIPEEDLVIYEMHVRGFTKGDASGVKNPGTYAAIKEKIPYLKELGVNCVELLPIFEFDEMDGYREVGGTRLYNYWGYSTVGFFAPKSGYSKVGKLGMAADELKSTIKYLHKNGIEVILDVVFNHTAEGNEYGPYISYRGIDNRTYYLLTPDGYYYNFSGCGNTMNCNTAIVRNHILDCLRYWVSDYHIDGFRFDLASILSRNEEGAPMTSPPLLEQLANDNILRKTKLIAEAWDADGMYQVGSFPNWGRWAEWNGRYRDCVRRFVKSEAEAGPELVWRLQGSPDMYGNRGPSASINFVTCHDGFTLMDLCSYNGKHNESNGEDNRDGANDNNSWNCGEEGETQNPEILALRRRQVKNAATLLLLSRGVPMILAGDEFGNTQYGNNNVYCQDSPVSWLNWETFEKNQDIFLYFKKLIKLRNEHPVIKKPDFFTEHNSSGYPELSFHSCKPWNLDANNPFHSFGFMYAEPAADFQTEKDTFIYCAVNAYWEEVHFELPILPEKMQWKIYLYSGEDKEGEDGSISGSEICLMPRSSMVLIGMYE